jgi:hypothetical protein
MGHTHWGRRSGLEKLKRLHRSGSLEGVGQGSGVREGQGRVTTGLGGREDS